jgi:uncharacterized protein
MSLLDRLDADLKQAMRDGDTTRRDTIRLLRSALKNAEIEKRAPLGEQEADKVVAREAKQRRDSIEEYRKGNRDDLVAKEQAELEILQAYQPEQLTEEALRDIVRESISRLGATGPADIGKVMKDVLPRVQGRADGGAVNAAARDLLAAASD